MHGVIGLHQLVIIKHSYNESIKSHQHNIIIYAYLSRKNVGGYMYYMLDNTGVCTLYSSGVCIGTYNDSRVYDAESIGHSLLVYVL